MKTLLISIIGILGMVAIMAVIAGIYLTGYSYQFGIIFFIIALSAVLHGLFKEGESEDKK